MRVFWKPSKYNLSCLFCWWSCINRIWLTGQQFVSSTSSTKHFEVIPIVTLNYWKGARDMVLLTWLLFSMDYLELVAFLKTNWTICHILQFFKNFKGIQDYAVDSSPLTMGQNIVQDVTQCAWHPISFDCMVRECRCHFSAAVWYDECFLKVKKFSFVYE